MHRTVKILRIVILILLVAFIAVVAAYYTRSDRGGTSTQGSIDSATRPDEKPQLVADQFEDVQTIGGRVVSRIRARRTTGFPSGWFTLEDAHLTLYRPDGSTYELTCPLAQFHKETKEALLQKGVRITSSDGIEITTEEMRYDGRRVINEIPLQFRIARWQGKAGGADIDVSHDSIRLVQGVETRFAPVDPGQPPTIVQSREAQFFRKVNEFIFNHNAVITHGTDTLRASSITARSDAAREKLTSLAGNGHVEISVGQGSPVLGETAEGVTSAKVLSDSFFASFGPDGELASMLSVSAGLSRATLGGPPQRELQARQFRVMFAGGRPSEMHAEEDVTMREIAQAVRTVTARNASFYFDQATGRMATASVSGNVFYSDGNAQARSERALLDVANDRVTMTALPNSQPVIVADGNTLKANKIEYAPKLRILRGTGAVMVHLMPQNRGAGASGTTVFPSGNQPVYVNAQTVTIRQDARTAVFLGDVRAWQETNTMFAKELRVTGDGEEVTAVGDVRCVLYNARDSARKTPVIMRAGQLVARKKENRILLDGNVRIDDETRNVTAEKSVLFFGADRRLDRVEFTQTVQLTDNATNRKGTGDSASYHVRQQMIYLKGAPATMTDPKGTIRGEQIVFDLGRDKVDIQRGASPSESTYNPEKKGQ